jgi:hypothetical protein
LGPGRRRHRTRRSRLTITGSGASTVLSFTEDDGTVTTWTLVAAPAADKGADFRPAE